MNFLSFVEMTVIAFAAVIYIAKAWNEAKRRRDGDFATRPGAGIDPNARKPSAVPYLFC